MLQENRATINEDSSSRNLAVIGNTGGKKTQKQIP